MRDIAQVYAQGFEQCGIPADIRLDEVPSGGSDPSLAEIVVAPHEYYPLFLRKQLSKTCLKHLPQNIPVSLTAFSRVKTHSKEQIFTSMAKVWCWSRAERTAPSPVCPSLAWLWTR